MHIINPIINSCITTTIEQLQQQPIHMQSNQADTYQHIYSKLLKSTDLQPLSRFKSTKTALLYPDTQSYPDFFNHNLMAPGRVIKTVKGKSSLIRAFNYQLMKLTFEIQVTEVDYVQVLKSVVFLPSLLKQDDDMQSPISGRAHNDRQYKRIIAQFIQMMGSQGIPNFQFTLMQYPIVDQALSYVIEALIARCYNGQNDSNSLLNWLASTFLQNIEKHGKCYKFQQSDIFLYEQNQQQYYIAFLNQMAQVSDYSQSTYKIDQKISGSNDRNSSSYQQQEYHKISAPNFSPQANDDDQDVNFKIATDKWRNSAQPPNWRNKNDIEEHQNIRKSCSNQFMREVIATHRSIEEESIEKNKLLDDKNKQQQKVQDDHSKIGSLLDMMSDRSSKQMEINIRCPEVRSSRQFQDLEEEQINMTSRTHEQVISRERSFQELKAHVTQSKGRGKQDKQEITTPQFQKKNSQTGLQQNYNPFTKKYSQKYMSQFYYKTTPNYGTSNQVPSAGHKPFQTSFNYQSDFKSKPSYTYESYSNTYNNEYKLETSNKFDYTGTNQSLYSAQGVGGYTGSNSLLKDSLEYMQPKTQEYSFLKKDNYQKYSSKPQDQYQMLKSKPEDFKLDYVKNNYQEFKLKTDRSETLDIAQYKPSVIVQDDEIFYRPQGKSKFGNSSKASQLRRDQLQVRGGGVQDTKGTIYREFTDTRVLNAMNSFQRMKTNTIRQRFHGVHRKDLYKKH